MLQNMKGAKDLSDLWEEVKVNSHLNNFERFILGLDLKFILGSSVEYKDNRIVIDRIMINKIYANDKRFKIN